MCSTELESGREDEHISLNIELKLSELRPQLCFQDYILFRLMISVETSGVLAGVVRRRRNRQLNSRLADSELSL